MKIERPIFRSLSQKSTTDRSISAGRFSEKVSDQFLDYTASIFFDYRLAEYDIRGSLAHAKMLVKQGILTQEDGVKIEKGLKEIQSEIASQKFSWRIEDEDIHLAIEARLTALIGEAGKKLHTARSRNDQVATDIRLWLRDQLDYIDQLLIQWQTVLLNLAEKHLDVSMPGFTHLQVAQPISFAHHLLAYVAMANRDQQRFRECRKRTNTLPLGSGALAGTTFPIDRNFVAEELGFESVSLNALDAVSDRDFAIEFCSNAAITLMHLSRLCEEIILWMNPRFNFIEVADRFCSGSSIMPQKKNPDVAEVTRGKSARVYGALTTLLTLMRSQPLAYNKDNQEDKEALFDCADTLTSALDIMKDMIETIKVKPASMRAALLQGHVTATDLADALVRKGLPFRDAHEVVGKAVKFAEEKNCDLSELSLKDLQSISNLIGADEKSTLSIESALHARNHIGGTAPEQALNSISLFRKNLS